MKNILLVVLLCGQVACQQKTDSEPQSSTRLFSPPAAEKIPRDVSVHGDSRVDNYYWMRDDTRTSPKVIAHLEAENTYTNQVMASTEKFQDELFDEMYGRIVKDDNSVPYLWHGHWYYQGYSGELEYPLFYRRAGDMEAPEEVLVDVNQLAQGREFFAFGGLEVSPDGKTIAYSSDTLSRRIYTIQFKDIESGELLPDKIEGAEPEIVWANDNKTIYYLKKDEQTLLADRVYRHTLGTSNSEDQLVYQENNVTFYTGIGKSLDESLILIYHSHSIKSGVSLIDANQVDAPVRLFQVIEKDHEYNVEKSGDYYYIHTNWEATNFRIMRVAVGQEGDRSRWEEFIPHREDTLIEQFVLLKDFLVLKEKRMAMTHMQVIPLKGKPDYYLIFDEKAASISFDTNRNFTSTALRVYYSSLTTPPTVYEYQLEDGSRKQLKQRKVLGDFDPGNYQSERIFINARDGKQVPVSIVYRKDLFNKDSGNPLYQYGYGSYGASISPGFQTSLLPLLDRGFVYAIAHIRGSQSLGRQWYEDGKLTNKKNTFTDFIDVTKALIEQKYADPERIFARGGSAGGLLMGSVANMAPELYTAIVANVPFVDVLTTMLDDSIPLTSNEWDEWGDPRDPDDYAYMKSYSPYDNVERKDYPAMLVTSGLHDSQVQYFEPAKWVAKLREYKTDDKLLLFKVNMQAGHGGASGRFRPYRDKALEYAFILDQAGWAR